MASLNGPLASLNLQKFQFPVEVIRVIAKQLFHDQRTRWEFDFDQIRSTGEIELKFCSVLGTEWRNECQSVLFSKVMVYSVKGLENLLANGDRILKYITELELNFCNFRPLLLRHKILILKLTMSCPRLISFRAISFDSPLFEDLILPILQDKKALQYLSLTYVSGNQPLGLPPHLKLPNLRELQLSPQFLNIQSQIFLETCPINLLKVDDDTDVTIKPIVPFLHKMKNLESIEFYCIEGADFFQVLPKSVTTLLIDRDTEMLPALQAYQNLPESEERSFKRIYISAWTNEAKYELLPRCDVLEIQIQFEPDDVNLPFVNAKVGEFKFKKLLIRKPHRNSVVLRRECKRLGIEYENMAEEHPEVYSDEEEEYSDED